MQGILGKYSETTANVTVQDRVNKTTGVTSIENYVSNLDVDTRDLSVAFNLNTIYGPTTIQIDNYTRY